MFLCVAFEVYWLPAFSLQDLQAWGFVQSIVFLFHLSPNSEFLGQQYLIGVTPVARKITGLA